MSFVKFNLYQSFQLTLFWGVFFTVFHSILFFVLPQFISSHSSLHMFARFFIPITYLKMTKDAVEVSFPAVNFLLLEKAKKKKPFCFNRNILTNVNVRSEARTKESPFHLFQEE